MIKAEYEAHWDCPKCEGLTYQSDDAHITFDNGDVLTVKCDHDVDNGGLDFEKCGHVYQVDLRS